MALRVNFIFIVLPFPPLAVGRRILSTKVVPGSPRNRLETYDTSLPAISESSIDTMMSPFLSPASSAGMPS